MAAPKRPNTEAATAATKRRGQESMAAKLRAAGWVVVPPEHADPPYPPDLFAHYGPVAEN